MKHTYLSSYYSLFLSFVLLTSPLISVAIDNIPQISEFEQNEMLKNPDVSYVYLGEDKSNLIYLVSLLKNVDSNHNSPINALQNHLDNGFVIAKRDPILETLTYAQSALETNNSNQKSSEQSRLIIELGALITQIANGLLNINTGAGIATNELTTVTNDLTTTANDLTIINNDITAIDNGLIVGESLLDAPTSKAIDSSTRTLFIDTKVDFLHKVDFDKDVKMKDDLTVKDNLTVNHTLKVEGNAKFKKNVSVKGTLSIADAVVQNISATNANFDNLTVTNCISDLCVTDLSVIDETISGTLTLNGALIINNATFQNVSVTDTLVSDHSITQTLEVTTGPITFDTFTPAGVVHNNASGVLSSSLIVNADITNATISNAKLATIASTDIPGAIVVRDGLGDFAATTVTITGPIVNPTDAATKAYVDAAIPATFDAKTPAVVVSTTNIVLSGLQTIDGVALVANNRVLLVGQTNPIQNGLWLVQTGAWTRPADFASGSVVGEAYVLILSGTVNGGSSWLANTPNAIVDTNPIGFALFALPNQTAGANVGAGTGLVFQSKTGNTLNFRSLIPANHIVITNNPNDITIATDATSANTPNTLVARDGSGNFSAGTITANLSGNATTATTATTTLTTVNFSGTLSGDVTGTQTATVVSTVGGQTATNVANGVQLANNSTSNNVANTIVRRNALGNFSAGTITASLAGNATSATNFSGPLAGDVTGTQSATVVSFVGGQTAANVATATIAANAATSLDVPNTIVERDGSGNFAAGTITANLIGNVTGSASLNVLKTGDSMSGTLTMLTQNAVDFQDTTGHFVGINAQAVVPTSYTLSLPTTVPLANQVLVADAITPTNLDWAFAPVIPASLTVTDATVTCELIVGCNIDMNNSTSALIGNITKGGNPFIQNFGTNNTFIGVNAGNFTTSGAGRNTALGVSALNANATGSSNTAIGFSAMSANTTGALNTAVGVNALAANTSGGSNTAIGSSTLLANTIGTLNTAIGTSTLQANTTGGSNTAVGSVALAFNTTGANNTGLGASALALNSTGINNTAVGSNALSSTTVDGNVAVGFNALSANTTGVFNTAVGTNALINNTVGTQNVAIGTNTLAANILTGSFNTGVGYQALLLNTTGANNVGIGNLSLALNATGIQNTGIGSGSLQNSTGSNNIALGFNAGNTATTGSNDIYIGNVGVAAESNTIRIGTLGTQAACFIQGISGVTVAGAVPALISATGQLGTIVSSSRFKHDIETMDVDSAEIYNLRPVTFAYNEDTTETKQYGLIAEEVDAVLPELVIKDENGQPYTVQYQVLPVLLLNELQKLAARVTALEYCLANKN